MKIFKILRLFFGGNNYCPECLELFNDKMEIKFKSGYNVTCSSCNTYIINGVIGQ